MNLKNLSPELEKLVFDIFTFYKLNGTLNYRIKNDEIDILIDNPTKGKVLIEVKSYRSRRIHLSQIKRAIEKLISITKNFKNSHAVLVITTYIDNDIKHSLEKRYGISIWDRSSLFFLTEESPELRERLDNILLYLLEDNEMSLYEEILPYVNSEIDRIWTLKPIYNDSYFKKGENLCEDLKMIPAGRENFAEFEDKCQEILEYIFENDLTGWYKQPTTDDSLNRYDLICRVASIHDFWISLNENFNSKYILFEFKNYSKPIKQGQVYTTEKYLFRKALRAVGFIIAKNGADENAIKAMKGSLREHGKLIVCLTPLDLCEMLKRKDLGDDPNSYMAEIIDDFLIKLSR